MKLLVLTQKIDKNDPVLGFFHNWVFKLSKKFEKISVICLEKGQYDLPDNIKVYSLGKESGRSKIKYVKNFLNLILGLYKEYDSVFVHMNQEYILLGGFIWKILRKKIYFWRNHPNGNLFTYVSVFLSNKVFCTSPYSFTKRFKKTEIMPVGIDTSIFNTDGLDQKEKSILSIGRISPIKNVEKMIDAVILLDNRRENFVLDIVGDPVNTEDYEYKKMLLNKGEALIKKGVLNFITAVSQKEAAILYKKHSIFVNLTPSGGMDKTILEAVLCGCIPVVSNQFFEDVFENKMLTSGEPEDIAQKIKFWLDASEEMVSESSKNIIEYTKQNHSLDVLIEKLSKELK